MKKYLKLINLLLIIFIILTIATIFNFVAGGIIIGGINILYGVINFHSPEYIIKFRDFYNGLFSNKGDIYLFYILSPFLLLCLYYFFFCEYKININIKKRLK